MTFFEMSPEFYTAWFLYSTERRYPYYIATPIGQDVYCMGCEL